MPFRKISRDLKLAAVRLYECDLLPLVDILDCLWMSESTFYRVLELWNTLAMWFDTLLAYVAALAFSTMTMSTT